MNTEIDPPKRSGFSKLPLPGGLKVAACTMFAGRLLAATDDGGMFVLDEKSEWVRVLGEPSDEEIWRSLPDGDHDA